MRDDERDARARELAALISRRLQPKHARPLPPERYRTPRASVALGNDHQSATRDEKIRDLVRMELHSMGGGDLPIGLAVLYPSRIIEAVDASPHLPASGIYVHRPTTPAELRAARAEREARSDVAPFDHLLVRAAALDAIQHTDTFHALTRIRDAREAAADVPAFPPADSEEGAD